MTQNNFSTSVFQHFSFLRRIGKLFLIFLFSTTLFTANAEVKLPCIVSDGMILQRDENIKIWGWANPGEKVTVRFVKKKYTTKADDAGTWNILLKPTPAGGPYQMTIEGENKITISNIMMGDVWVCSGQSNMTHYFGRHQERYAKEIAEANIPEIRQFYVPTNPALEAPLNDIPNLKWVEATPESILKFTLVGYFFAKKLYDEYHIPMGIINTCVGGTPIEAWMSEEGFNEFPDIQKNVKQLQDTAYVNAVNRAAKADREANATTKIKDKGLNGDVKWYETSYEPLNWKRINIPGYWENQGIRNLDGVVWYRKYIDVAESMVGVEALVKFGRIVDADDLYINGQRVAGTGYQYPQREYRIPAGVLKSGKNLFVIRIRNDYGLGGFVPDKPYWLLAAGDSVDLKGYWEYKVGEVFSHDKQLKQSISTQNSPTALYNGMIAPFINYGVKGVLWYQGESNSGNPDEYRKLLPNLIVDWRNKWNNETLPFFIAQLPNYMDVNYLPEESNWAEMRDIQLQTSLNVPNVGLGVNIELGEWNDIHPGNKKPVGERLALSAMRIVYGDTKTVTSGPIFKSYELDGSKVVLSFDYVGSGLTVNNGEPLAHFAIAGADKKFVWATAEIVDNKVIIWSDEVPEPKYVRYAWADNPDFANLYNKEGLPASPFQISLKP